MIPIENIEMREWMHIIADIFLKMKSEYWAKYGVKVINTLYMLTPHMKDYITIRLTSTLKILKTQYEKYIMSRVQPEYISYVNAIDTIMKLLDKY